ncbi:hypothetical protein Q9233_000592 [Columba guinea]|nr:hypothetical protein Q9233_000592 [Columba guinea]
MLERQLLSMAAEELGMSSGQERDSSVAGLERSCYQESSQDQEAHEDFTGTRKKGKFVNSRSDGGFPEPPGISESSGCSLWERKELARTITALESQIQYCRVGVPWTYPTIRKLYCQKPSFHMDACRGMRFLSKLKGMSLIHLPLGDRLPSLHPTILATFHFNAFCSVKEVQKKSKHGIRNGLLPHRSFLVDKAICEITVQMNFSEQCIQTWSASPAGHFSIQESSKDGEKL